MMKNRCAATVLVTVVFATVDICWAPVVQAQANEKLRRKIAAQHLVKALVSAKFRPGRELSRSLYFRLQSDQIARDVVLQGIKTGVVADGKDALTSIDRCYLIRTFCAFPVIPDCLTLPQVGILDQGCFIRALQERQFYRGHRGTPYQILLDVASDSSRTPALRIGAAQAISNDMLLSFFGLLPFGYDDWSSSDWYGEFASPELANRTVVRIVGKRTGSSLFGDWNDLLSSKEAVYESFQDYRSFRVVLQLLTYGRRDTALRLLEEIQVLLDKSSIADKTLKEQKHVYGYLKNDKEISSFVNDVNTAIRHLKETPSPKSAEDLRRLRSKLVKGFPLDSRGLHRAGVLSSAIERYDFTVGLRSNPLEMVRLAKEHFSHPQLRRYYRLPPEKGKSWINRPYFRTKREGAYLLAIMTPLAESNDFLRSLMHKSYKPEVAAYAAQCYLANCLMHSTEPEALAVKIGKVMGDKQVATSAKFRLFAIIAAQDERKVFELEHFDRPPEWPQVFVQEPALKKITNDYLATLRQPSSHGIKNLEDLSDFRGRYLARYVKPEARFLHPRLLRTIFDLVSVGEFLKSFEEARAFFEAIGVEKHKKDTVHNRILSECCSDVLQSLKGKRDQ